MSEEILIYSGCGSPRGAVKWQLFFFHPKNTQDGRVEQQSTCDYVNDLTTPQKTKRTRDSQPLG